MNLCVFIVRVLGCVHLCACVFVRVGACVHVHVCACAYYKVLVCCDVRTFSGLSQGILPRVIKNLVDRRRGVKDLLKREKNPVVKQQLDIRQKVTLSSYLPPLICLLLSLSSYLSPLIYLLFSSSPLLLLSLFSSPLLLLSLFSSPLISLISLLLFSFTISVVSKLSRT